MSHEFAPSVVSTENRSLGSCGIELAESLGEKKRKALNVYERASSDMRRRDEKVDAMNLRNGNDGLTPTFNKNAITAASLLMVAALRAAEIS